MPSYIAGMTVLVGDVDVAAISDFSEKLFHNCQILAVNAPQSFKQLVNELSSLHSILQDLCDRISSGAFSPSELDRDRQRMLKGSLSDCRQTLQRIDDVLDEYREIGLGGRPDFWRRIGWVLEAGPIPNFQSRVRAHADTLNRYVRISRLTWRTAPTSQDSIPIHKSTTFTELPSQDQKTCSAYQSRESSYGGTSRNEGEGTDVLTSLDKISRSLYGITTSPIFQRPVSTSSSSTTFTQHDDLSEHTVPTPVSPISPPWRNSISFKTRRQTPPSPKSLRRRTLDSNHRRSDAVIDENSKVFVAIQSPADKRNGWVIKQDPEEVVTSVPRTFLDDGTEDGSKFITVARSVSPNQKPSAIQEEGAMAPEVVTDATSIQWVRDFRAVPQSKSHRPDAYIKRQFEDLVQRERDTKLFTTRDWLRLATWWLLKARSTLTNHQRSSLFDPQKNAKLSEESRIHRYQGYADLLKVSYILHDFILNGQHIRAPLSQENQKPFHTLSDAMDEAFSEFEPADVPDRYSLEAQNLKIWEPGAPDGIGSRNLNYDDRRQHLRWIAIEQDESEHRDERVLLRSFVDAGVVSEKRHTQTTGAPYMLILFVKNGKNKLQIAICNQSGSFYVEKDLDLKDFNELHLHPLFDAQAGTLSHIEGRQTLPFIFGNLNLLVSFPFQSDFSRFISTPKSYFDAVRRREPRKGTNASEKVLFKTSIKEYEQLKPFIMKPAGRRKVYGSCEVRILEQCSGQSWRQTRRIVISSSAAERQPWSTEFFMPISRVQVMHHEESSEVYIRWSDTAQESFDRTDGSYNIIYSYVYDHSNPNIGLRLEFRDSDDAKSFAETVLSLSIKPCFTWSQPESSGHVYNVVDTEPGSKKYKAILVIRKKSDWQYCDLYYTYRDMDYIYDESKLFKVRFVQIYYVDYISSHIDKLFKPDRTPGFSHCEMKTTDATISFHDEGTLRAFMGSLTLYCQLLFSRRAHWISTKDRSRFVPTRSHKGDAEIQLWKRASELHVAARWNSDQVVDRWLTVSVTLTSVQAANVTRDGSNRAILPKTNFSRGMLIDMAFILAKHPRSPNNATRQGPITIAFDGVGDREAFIAVLQDKMLSQSY